MLAAFVVSVVAEAAKAVPLVLVQMTWAFPAENVRAQSPVIGAAVATFQALPTNMKFSWRGGMPPPPPPFATTQAVVAIRRSLTPLGGVSEQVELTGQAPPLRPTSEYCP